MRFPLSTARYVRYYEDVRGGRQGRLMIRWRDRVVYDLPFGKVKGEWPELGDEQRSAPEQLDQTARVEIHGEGPRAVRGHSQGAADSPRTLRTGGTMRERNLSAPRPPKANTTPTGARAHEPDDCPHTAQEILLAPGEHPGPLGQYSYAEPCAWIGQLHPPGWVPNSIDNTQAQRHGYPPRTELIDPGGDDAGR